MAVDAQTRLVEEFTYHSQEVFRLKALLNSRRPISKLPPEILSTIFLQQAEAYQQDTLLRWRVTRDDNHDTPAHKSIYTWTSVALVCRRWREIALKCARLWTCLVLDERVPGDYARTILRRSRGLPLTVVMHALFESHCAGCVPDHAAEDQYAEAVNILEEVLPNTRKLALFIGAEKLDSLYDALCHPAPRLEWLHIEGVAWYATRWATESHVVSFPEDAFTPGIPPLRHLSVSTIAFDWDSPLLFPTLRHIKVQHRKQDPAEGTLGLPMGELLEVLRRTPELEALDIDKHSLPIPEVAVPYRPVVLPHLRTLKLSLENLHSFSLLQHLRFPSTTTLHLTNNDKYGDFPEPIDPAMLYAVQSVVAAALRDTAVYCIAIRFPRSSFREIDRSPVCHIYAESIGSDGTLPALPDSYDALEGKIPRLSLELRLGNILLDMVFAALDLRHLRVISMQDPMITPSRWTNTLGRAENVTMIDVQDSMAYGLGAQLVGWVRPLSMDAGAPPGWDGTPLRPANWVGLADAPEETLRFADEGTPAGGDGSREGTATLSVHFPRLRVLRISRVAFAPSDRERLSLLPQHADSVRHVLSGGTRTPDGLDDRGLARSLRLRSEHGAARLERLEFVGCRCQEWERLAPLMDAVSELWWDGRRITSTNFDVLTV